MPGSFYAHKKSSPNGGFFLAQNLKLCIMYMYNSYVYIHSNEKAGDAVNIILSNTAKEPIYVQIKEQIKQSVLDNTLKPGDALPSIRKLAKDLQVSVITTKRAYEELEREGFIESVVGRGSFIAGKTDEWIREQQLKQVEDKLADAVKESRVIGLTLDELKEMLELIYKGDE